MKRPIDKLRDGAGSFTVGADGDDSAIVTMITIADERMFIVKERGIYEVKLADQIDPKRTNIKVPNTIQRVMSVGTDTPWVATVLLTADGLFRHAELLQGIDCARALTLVFEIAQHIERMHEVKDEYVKAQNIAAGAFDPRIRNRSVTLPTVANAQARCKEFLQKADHVLRELLALVKLFYGDADAAWEGLQAKIREEPAIDNFADWLDNNVPFLVTVRNARNAAEHPNARMRIGVEDFIVDASNALCLPTLMVMHPKTPVAKIPIESFMTEVLERTVHAVELLMVFLCSRHVGKASGANGFPICVAEIPEGQRRSRVRYGLGMMVGDQFVPMS